MRRSIFVSVVIGALFCVAEAAFANDVLTTSTLRRGTQITASDLEIKSNDPAEREALLSQYVGMSVIRTVAAGTVMRPRDVAEPVQVRRNSQVKMIYRMGRLEITATGRALGQGRMGDIIPVMNLESRKRVEGKVTAFGTVEMIR